MSAMVSGTIIISIIILHMTTCSADKSKYVYVSSEKCDRFSLDALYHEKYEIVTEEVLTDSKVFVKNVIDKVEDSLQKILIQLPEEQQFSQQEMEMHYAMTSLKDGFAMKIKKVHNNITSHWDNFIKTNHQFLGAEDKITFRQLIKYVVDLQGAYDTARRTMDEQMERVVSSVKVIVHNGLLSATQIAEQLAESHHHEHNDSDIGNKTKEEKLKDMVQDIIPSFLRTVTEKIIDRKVNLSVPVTKTADNRDSVLDDLCFAVTMMKAKVIALEPDYPHIQEYVDLARRNLYMLWADIVNSFYEDKISEKAEKTPWKGNSTERFEKFWSNEDELADTLITLMEVYP